MCRRPLHFDVSEREQHSGPKSTQVKLALRRFILQHQLLATMGELKIGKSFLAKNFSSSIFGQLLYLC